MKNTPLGIPAIVQTESMAPLPAAKELLTWVQLFTAS